MCATEALVADVGAFFDAPYLLVVVKIYKFWWRSRKIHIARREKVKDCRRKKGHFKQADM